jgi:cellulose synthase/poly-beta-1,6-N-acetylglucosamine synthase-like glycosyltransferase
MLLLLTLSVAVLGYVYAGYPPLLRLLVRLRGARHVKRADITPPLSLVISAYNEAAVIRSRIENALSLDYPRDALDIVVVSDACTDGTDEIVMEYASQGVILARQDERRGKTAGLNRTVPTLRGDIVVFSDANAMYEPDALRKLARNFADPRVGCVTGEARYLAGGSSAADVGERAYWNYEIQIKRLETALGSTVGGDGAIYAIRRSLWQTLPDDAINDFLNPLQIVAAGWRAVYEPEAICYEETAGGMRTEYRRRIRIVSRSWRAVFQAPGVLNPRRVGMFTWSLMSHKVLRWWSSIFVVLAGVGAIGTFAELYAWWPALALGLLAAAIVFATATPVGRRATTMLAYFTVINAASLLGVLKGQFGRVSGVWTTPRAHDPATRPGVIVPVGRVLLAAGALALMGLFVMALTLTADAFATLIFWTTGGLLAYVYAGYPALLSVLRRVASRPVRHAPIEPSVCLFIAANDEAAVIEAKLHNTLTLDYPADRLEVIVASDGSVDETNEIVRRFAPRVRLLEFSPRRGKIAVINEGMRAVTSEIVVLSDANTFLASDAIRALVSAFADDAVGAVSGDVVLVGHRAALGRSEDLYYRYERWIQRAESDLGSMIGADGALYAIRRSLFVPPPEDTVLDDMAIPMAVVRARRRVVFEGRARAFEQGSGTAREEFARKTRVIAGAVQFIGRGDSAVPLRMPQAMLSLVSHKALRWLSPVFAAALLVSSLVLADDMNGYTLAAAGQLGLIALGTAGAVPRLRQINVIALAHYFCLVQLAAAVGFLRGLTRRQSVLWQRFDRPEVPSPVVHAK